MLKIKLARFGKRNQPHYRVVVNEARDKRDGSYTALLGHYAPTQEPKLLEIDLEAYDKWVSQGAQPTETVASLVERFRSGNPFPKKAKKPSKKQLAKQAEAKKEKATAKEEEKTAEPKEEKPAEEAQAEEKSTETESKPEEKAGEEKK